MAIISSDVVTVPTPLPACVFRAGIVKRDHTITGIARDTITLNAKSRNQVTLRGIWRQCKTENS